ncbi:unnamed protein product [Spodoptera exigua]|nr:unnamed protein product [Spodoptera exigua]
MKLSQPKNPECYGKRVSGNTNQALGVSRRSLGRQCVDGTRYKIDPCNYCMCVYGQDVCTDINCAATDLAYVMSVPCKEGNTRQIDNCNRCTCEKGLYVCTDEICEIDRINRQTSRRSKCKRAMLRHEWVGSSGVIHGLTENGVKQPQRCVSPFDDDEYLEEFYDSVSLEELTDKESDSSDIYNDIDFDTSAYFKDKEPDTSSYFKIKEFGNIFKDVFHIFRARSETQDGPPSSTPLSWIFSPSQPNTDSQVVTPPSWQTYNNETSVEVLRLLDDYDGQTVVVDPTHRSGQDPYLRVNNDKIDTKKTKHCNVGERYRLGACNYCYCNELGIRICTRHSCDNHGTELPDSEYIPKEYETECKIGVRFRLDKCNYCYCNAHRQLICSKNKCPSSNDHILPQLRANDDSCIDGSQRQKDACNYCICINGIEMCTQKPCLDNVPRGLKPLDLVRSLLQSLYSQSQIPPQMLEPGCNKEMLYLPEDYDPECPNVCLCDGNELFCTHRQCDKTDSKIHEPKNTPHKTINTKPGKTLRKYCREKDKFQMGFPPYCAQCKCLSNQWDCSVKGESCSDYSLEFSSTTLAKPQAEASIHLNEI